MDGIRIIDRPNITNRRRARCVQQITSEGDEVLRHITPPPSTLPSALVWEASDFCIFFFLFLVSYGENIWKGKHKMAAFWLLRSKVTSELAACAARVTNRCRSNCIRSCFFCFLHGDNHHVNIRGSCIPTRGTKKSSCQISQPPGISRDVDTAALYQQRRIPFQLTCGHSDQRLVKLMAS